MPIELNLRFPDAAHVIVCLGPGDGGSGLLDFVNPITEKDLRDIRWYVEIYGAHSLGDPDDKEAACIKAMLPMWGASLFKAVFYESEADRRFHDFKKSRHDSRLLTISTEHSAILALPWELLHDPSPGGDFLFMENPRVSIRRKVAGNRAEQESFNLVAKDTLRLLFVVSRPSNAGYIDPRADSRAVLDAIDAHAPGRVTCEFLRFPSLRNLAERLGDKSLPPVDILHFDGHGVFDKEGVISDRVPGTGYLLFENQAGGSQFISAGLLAENLDSYQISLVILSACQSAAMSNEKNNEPEAEPREASVMGSVAAGLMARGVACVLAMTHSILAHTTRALFGQFYQQLARHKGVGEALDNARQFLSNHPEKYEVQRGSDRMTLKLYDWFLPALYQSGTDTPLLTALPADGLDAPVLLKTNLLPAPKSGFYGRKRVLWDIERWFAGPTRRVTLTGFGGQGKTALAQEAGRWLLRTGLFHAAVFMDYSTIQNRDAVAVAVSNIGSVLGETLIDADAVTAAVRKTPTLIILDNLETLTAESLQALLTAAVPWSQANGSRVLCTTRQPDFGHADYRIEGTHVHRRIQLEGLGSRQAPDDALEWCGALMRLPPAPTVPALKREALIELFDLVGFHPLSIRVLAQQFKTRWAVELGERLEELLAVPQQEIEDAPAGLLASLELSLDKLDVAAWQFLLRMGVIQGGAMEPELVAIIGLDHDLWPALRHQLEAVALIEPEYISEVGLSFVRFHPTLAPMLWARLDAKERGELSIIHRQRYYTLSDYLYREDNRNPHRTRAIARRELPNLLHAVHAAFEANDSNAVDFAGNVNRFLDYFSLQQEEKRLADKVQGAAEQAGTRAWYLVQSNRGEQLRAASQLTEAALVFQEILVQLGDKPVYERALTLGRLSQCFRENLRPDLAVKAAEEGLAVCGRLEQSVGVRRYQGVLLTDKAAALMAQGEYTGARKAYEEGMKIKEALHDLRGKGVILGQLGTLAMQEGNLTEAADLHRAALALFQKLREPASEAVARHQLGRVFEESRQWDEAERHYREAARIREECGDHTGAAKTWHQLALVNKNAGNLEAAERWYRKAIERKRKYASAASLALSLNNLANLLQSQPGRLAEARSLAEEALVIRQKLDPDAAEIWKTYHVLAEITEREAVTGTNACRQAEQEVESRDYRRLAREAKRNSAGAKHELRRYSELILAVVNACASHAEKDEVVAQYQQIMFQDADSSLQTLSQVLTRILAGERDESALCDELDYQKAMIVGAILQGITDPSTLTDLRPSDPSKDR